MSDDDAPMDADHEGVVFDEAFWAEVRKRSELLKEYGDGVLSTLLLTHGELGLLQMLVGQKLTYLTVLRERMRELKELEGLHELMAQLESLRTAITEARFANGKTSRPWKEWETTDG